MGKNIFNIISKFIGSFFGKESQKQIDMPKMTRENAIKMDLPCSSLDEWIHELFKLKENGKSVYFDFNGYRIYSSEVEKPDDVYLIVFKETKYEHKKKEEQRLDEIEQLKAEASNNIPRWIQEGRQFIYPENMNAWKIRVRECAEGSYNGDDLNAALVLMKKLYLGDPVEEVAQSFYRQEHSGASGQHVRDIILDFARRGPEFYEITCLEPLSPEEITIIQERKKTNSKLDQLHPADKVTEDGERKENEIDF